MTAAVRCEPVVDKWEGKCLTFHYPSHLEHEFEFNFLSNKLESCGKFFRSHVRSLVAPVLSNTHCHICCSACCAKLWHH